MSKPTLVAPPTDLRILGRAVEGRTVVPTVPLRALVEPHFTRDLLLRRLRGLMSKPTLVAPPTDLRILGRAVEGRTVVPTMPLRALVEPHYTRDLLLRRLR